MPETLWLNPHLESLKPLYTYLCRSDGRPLASPCHPIDADLTAGSPPNLISRRLGESFLSGLGDDYWENYEDFLAVCLEAGLVVRGYLDPTLQRDSGLMVLGRAEDDDNCRICGRRRSPLADDGQALRRRAMRLADSRPPRDLGDLLQTSRRRSLPGASG